MSGCKRSRSRTSAAVASDPNNHLKSAPRDEAAPVREVVNVIDFHAHQRVLAHHPHLQAVGGLDEHRVPVIGVRDRDDVGAAFGVATESGDNFRAKQILNLGG